MGNITVALAGNPNTGKTSFFNNITGARQHVGNWPGVTVEKREGEMLYKGKLIKIVDLPGTYSLGAYSEDEIVAREYILNEEPNIIVNVVDATNLKRNLYLTIQILEMGAEVIVALNMMDETKKLGLDINLTKLSDAIGAKVVPTIATKKYGLENIIKAIGQSSEIKSKNKLKINYGQKVEETISKISNILEQDKDVASIYPVRWLAIKLLEGDDRLAERVSNTINGKKVLSQVEKLRKRLEKSLNGNLDSYFITKRYEFIENIVGQCLTKTKEEKVTATDKIDSLLTHNRLGIPMFMAIMFLVFTFTFKVSEPLTGLIEQGLEASSEWLAGIFVYTGFSEIFSSFFIDGVIGGIGAVLGIVPVIFTLFIAIAILEDSGYMARIAYIMDKPMRKIGLNGKAFIPFLLGFGCNVPAIMSTRTLDSKRDKLLSIISNPFISCSARLPVYVLFAGIFFKKNQVLVVGSLYLLGILMAIITSKVFGGFIPEEENSSFIIELPPYRFPTPKGVFIHMWEKVSDFIKRVSTIVLAAVIVIWLLSSLPFGVEYASDQSVIGKLSSFIAPILKPAGFGTWQATIALVFGVLAKEIVISTLGVVYKGGGATLAQHFTPLSAYSFMVMTLLYAPCIATIGVIKSETKSIKWTVITVLYGLVVAWVISVLIYQGGLMLGFK